MRGIGLGIPGPVGAISEEEMRGLLRPYQRPEPGPLSGILGPSVGQRMGEADASQQARWAAGERSPTPLTEDNMWLADDVAGSFVGPLGMAGIFAGVGARTANRSALEMAERMAKEGADPRAIWRDTGWFQGPDAKWRWEIDDSGAGFSPWAASDLERGRSISGPAGEVFPHRPLADAYPEMANLPTMVTREGGGTSHFNVPAYGRSASTEIRAPDAGRRRSVALHELQHGVQAAEGHDIGNSFRRTGDEMRDWNDYMRSLGEVEARATQSRADLTPQQRRERFPMDDYSHGAEDILLTPANADAWRAYYGDWASTQRPQSSGWDRRPPRQQPTKAADQRRAWDRRPPPAAPDLPEQIAGLLREGRASEVTDDMLGRLDPNQNRRLVELYEQGATGMPMPMDEASRMGRAERMGFNTDATRYHGTKSDVATFDPTKTVDGSIHLGSRPEQANMRTYGDGANIIPAHLREGQMRRSRDSDGYWKAKAKSAKKAGTDTVEYLNRYEGIPRERIEALDESGLLSRLDNLTDAQFRRAVPEAADSYLAMDPANIRSRFARFDPRLARNANLLASMGGAGLLGYGMAPGQEDDIDPEFIRLFGR
jgi:hypothetical protein